MKKQIVLISALTASLLTFFPSQKSSASVLTFDINGIQNGALISQDYGDNINSTNNGIFNYEEGNGFTPNITVSNNLSFWQEGYGDLNGVGYSSDGEGLVSFTPDTGYRVRLNSFDIASYAPDQNDQILQILDGNDNILLDLGPLSFQNVETQTFTNLNIVSGGILKIRFGNNDFIGIDNIDFDQVLEIPEPSSMVGILFLGGLGLASMKKKEKIRG
ncbi:hypothetical protein AA637_09330 [Cyanobacterium sp. HL-69]|uniref:PEP-CTERM sorting domain-containing protein n=1 Tax=Cyanobacterium sp. HL-69 TaxID=2054282 RepID=UPI000CA17B63|nr:hypothetical protein AA637_09330 [Cyanobacterium sp. HL-69]